MIKTGALSDNSELHGQQVPITLFKVGLPQRKQDNFRETEEFQR